MSMDKRLPMNVPASLWEFMTVGFRCLSCLLLAFPFAGCEWHTVAKATWGYDGLVALLWMVKFLLGCSMGGSRNTYILLVFVYALPNFEKVCLVYNCATVSKLVFHHIPPKPHPLRLPWRSSSQSIHRHHGSGPAPISSCWNNVTRRHWHVILHDQNFRLWCLRRPFQSKHDWKVFEPL